jgi:C1A family cysteine protease
MFFRLAMLMLLVQFSLNAFTTQLAHKILSNLRFTLNEAELFQVYINVYNKQYKITSHEGMHRFELFKSALAFIDLHNSNKTQYTITSFADLSSEEFKQYINNNSKISNKRLLKNSPASMFAADGIKIDWKNKLSSVKNQGSCGSCWAFAAAGAIEGALAVNAAERVELSVQELVDCSKDGNEGCNGGFPHIAFEYVAKHGLGEASSNPYNATDGQCKINEGPRVTISAYDYCSNLDDGLPSKPCSLKKWLSMLAMGPIVVVTDASSRHLQYYYGGVLHLKAGECQKINHAVLAVGFADNVITVRNSWGDSWGEGGHFRIQLDEHPNQTCFITGSAYLPIL